MTSSSSWLSGQRTEAVFSTLVLADVLGRFGKVLPPVLDAVHKLLPEGAVVAGGSIAEVLAGLLVKDIDLWFTSQEAHDAALEAIRAALGSGALTGYSEVPVRNSFMFVAAGKSPVALHNRFFFDSAEHVLDMFDFTVAQAALTSNRTSVLVGPTALDDIEHRRLVFHKEQPTMYFRVKRYIEKGFAPTDAAWERIRALAPRLAQETDDLKAQTDARRTYEISVAARLAGARNE